LNQRGAINEVASLEQIAGASGRLVRPQLQSEGGWRWSFRFRGVRPQSAGSRNCGIFTLGDGPLDFMSSINLAIVGLRLLAIYCCIQSVPLFSTFGFTAVLFAPESFGRSQSLAIFTALLPGGFLLMLAILLFIFSHPLARRIASPASPEPGGSACTLEQVQAIAFGVAGLLILAAAFPGLARALQGLVVGYAHHKQSGVNSADWVFSSWAQFAGVIVQFLVGALLLLNPKGFRNVWRYLRTAGT
jgi:hypothetical protein